MTDTNKVLAEFMGLEFSISRDGIPDHYPGYINGKFICWQVNWNPLHNIEQAMMCEEIMLRERPEEYVEQLSVLIIPSAEFICRARCDYERAFLSATAEQRCKAMIEVINR